MRWIEPCEKERDSKTMLFFQSKVVSKDTFVQKKQAQYKFENGSFAVVIYDIQSKIFLTYYFKSYLEDCLGINVGKTFVLPYKKEVEKRLAYLRKNAKEKDIF